MVAGFLFWDAFGCIWLMLLLHSQNCLSAALRLWQSILLTFRMDRVVFVLAKRGSPHIWIFIQVYHGWVWHRLGFAPFLHHHLIIHLEALLHMLKFARSASIALSILCWTAFVFFGNLSCILLLLWGSSLVRAPLWALTFVMTRSLLLLLIILRCLRYSITFLPMLHWMSHASFFSFFTRQVVNVFTFCYTHI